MNFMMKKGVFPRIAAVLMILTLFSTCVISGTFAKYVTEGSTTATARVAKWGVKIEASPTDESGAPFKNSYATNGEVTNLKGEKIENAVLSTTGAVVAPGTSGGLGAINVSGTPEVAVNIAYTVTSMSFDNWTAEGAFYCPLVFKIGAQTITGTEYASDTELVEALTTAIEGFSDNYEAGTDLSTLSDPNNVSITWDWPIDGDNAKDTELGNAETPATISLELTVTVTQID